MNEIYHFSDGKTLRGHGDHHRAEEAAYKYCRDNDVKIVKVERTERPLRIRDGIPDEPHYNRGLGMVIKNKRHYQEVLRQKGLVELGNEVMDLNDEKCAAGYIDEDTIREMNQMGLSMDDNQAEHLIDLDQKDELHKGLEGVDPNEYDPKNHD